MQHIDTAIIGAGIVGLAHAWEAARLGHSVMVFERSPRAQGASVRNFGMVWPIGQSPGAAYQTALRSRERWLELSRAAGFAARECGSIHLAHRPDEWAVLQEFAARGSELGYDCRLLKPAEIANKTPAANPAGLLGGLWSPTEVCVDPRRALEQIPSWLHEKFGVSFHFNTAIRRVDSPVLEAGDGREWSARRIVVCNGADFETLFPDIYARAGLKRCKLQMLRTVPQPAEWKIGPHLASGLTLRHYKNFEVCESLAALKRRVREETPELDRYGIHVMAAQNELGEVVLGDSHEYDGAIEPFDKAEIDELMLTHLRKLIRIPDWTIAARWHGIYAKHADRTFLEADPQPNVKVMTATGGAGMTLSFGLAEAAWQAWS